MPVILIEVLAGFLSILGAGAIGSDVIQQLIRKILKIEEKRDAESHRDKLGRLLGSLSKASEEVDAVLQELGTVAKHRQEALQKLDTDLKTLESREQQLQETIKALENIPIPAADYLANAANAGERRSARRDYILFGFGVIVSTIVTIILHVFGLG